MAADVTRTLAIKVVGDTKPLSKGLSKLGKIAAGAAVGGLFAVSYAAIEGVKAFRAEQTIVRAFTRTVRNMGIPVAEATRVMDRMATRAVNLGFDDAETIAGMSTFVKLTGDINKAASLTALAFDIARSKGIDLAAAQKIAAGIYKGSARALKDYGLEGVKGMEAVRKAAAKERKQAEAWARDHPFEVGIGKISDAWADLVGNLANANFDEAAKAAGKLGTAIQRTLFGVTFSSGRHEKGLIDKMGDWGKSLADAIIKGVSEIDWGTKLGEILNSAVGAVSVLVASDGLKNVGVLAGALALVIFSFQAFSKAAVAMFSAPMWLAKGTIGLAAAAAGTILSGVMTIAMWSSQAAIDLLGGGAKYAFGKLAAQGGVVGKAATLLGSSIGGYIAFAIGAALVGNAVKNFIADKLSELFRSLGVPENVIEAGRKQGDFGSPFQMLHNLGVPGFARGTMHAPRGVALVGERGPELVKFRGGEQVLSSRASMAALGGGTTVVVPITVNAAPGADGARIGRELAGYLDQFFARGGRFRYRPVGGTS